ncbi:MAG: hypothetical protein ACJ790_19500 [Myxococcaceae bacterium]
MRLIVIALIAIALMGAGGVAGSGSSGADARSQRSARLSERGSLPDGGRWTVGVPEFLRIRFNQDLCTLRVEDGGAKRCVVVRDSPFTVACSGPASDGGCEVYEMSAPPQNRSTLNAIHAGQLGDFGPYEAPYVQPAGQSFDKPDLRTQ